MDTPQALPMFEVDDFESYGGYGLKGSLVLDLKPGLTDAASGFHLSYRLQGVDPECSKGPGAVVCRGIGHESDRRTSSGL